jgi:hypothetical protein
MLGPFRPSEVSRVLTTGLPEFARYFFEGIDAVLIEPQSSQFWEVLGTKAFVDYFERLGLAARRPALSGGEP